MIHPFHPGRLSTLDCCYFYEVLIWFYVCFASFSYRFEALISYQGIGGVYAVSCEESDLEVKRTRIRHPDREM